MLGIFGNNSGYLLGSQRNREVNGSSIEGRGIPGTWTRQEESQQIYLLGKGHAEVLQMLELSKRHTVASESNLWGGLHAAHSLSKQQPRDLWRGDQARKTCWLSAIAVPLCVPPDRAQGTREQIWGHGWTPGITRGTCPTCEVPSGVIS